MKIVSLGQSCFIKMWLEKVFGSSETHVFDWSITTPDILLDCLLTDFKYYHLIGTTDLKFKHIENVFDDLDKNKSFNNKYGNYFIHYNEQKELLESMMKRRCDRFISLLNNNESIYFIYCHYSYIFSDVNDNWKILNEKQDEFYKILEQCAILMTNKNPNIKIISINTKEYDSEYITNINISDDDMSIMNKITPQKRKSIYENYFFYLKNIII